jgi:hypothetical protein
MMVWTLLPAYARPATPAPGAIEVETPAAVFYDRRIELLGYNAPKAAVAGEPVQFSLCWQAVAPVPENYTLFLEVVGADNQGYGRLATYPGRGNHPTSAWGVHEPFCDAYDVEMGADIPAPALARVRVVWVDDAAEQPLPVETFAAEPLADAEFNVPFKVAAPAGYYPLIANAADYAFGSTTRDAAPLRLTGYALEPAAGGLRVTLRWEPLATLPGDLVVFVHLRDTPETVYASGDSQPLNGAYPSWLWQPGETVMDPHLVTLPEASGPRPPLDLYVGVYDAELDERLPAFDAAGNQLPANEVVLERGVVP